MEVTRLLKSASPEACQKHGIDSVLGTPTPHDDTTLQPLPEPETETECGSISADGLENVQPSDDNAAKVAAIESLLAAYIASFPAPAQLRKDFKYVEYFKPARMAKVRAHHGPRLDKAKQLATALLTYYYPPDQGFQVRPVNFPLLEPGGWRTWIYPEDSYAAPRRKASGMKGPLKKNIKLVYEPFSGNPNADKFHRIEPEHIAGFVVLSEVHYPGGATGWAQHTYLAIMMDDLDTFEHWVPESLTSSSTDFVSLPRADIMNDALGAQAGIAEGYAVLMLGPRVEFYEYKAEPEWEERDWEYYLGPDPEDGEYVADRDAALETSCFSRLGSSIADREKNGSKRGDLEDRSWAVDMREGSASQALDAVDSLFRSVVGRDVLYRGGYSLPGPQL